MITLEAARLVKIDAVASVHAVTFVVLCRIRIIGHRYKTNKTRES